MTDVKGTIRTGDPKALRVERLVERCADWVLQERHRKVLVEIEKILPSVHDTPELEAQLLLWKAQALLATGAPERALAVASRSWDLDASPHACYLAAEALLQLGESDRAEELLQTGCAVFPGAPHLAMALAMLLADQGRMPEALRVVEEIELSPEEPAQTHVFRAGFHANLLASMGRWDEAMAVLDATLGEHPGSELLARTREDLRNHRARMLAAATLTASWRVELGASPPPWPDVEEEIVHLARTFEAGDLLPMAACRLSRAYAHATGVRPRQPAPWALALLLTVMKLDGEAPATAPFARAAHVSPSSVRPIRRRLDGFLADLEPEIVLRSFGCTANPRLDEPPARGDAGGTVVPFRPANGERP
ncbi:MAG TPA: tetratricopeptide repeat protein [Acidobacteria bacterium]|nr:tetratricopeptide repeat protein [Acidobacteriota bacterium]